MVILVFLSVSLTAQDTNVGWDTSVASTTKSDGKSLPYGIINPEDTHLVEVCDGMYDLNNHPEVQYPPRY